MSSRRLMLSIVLALVLLLSVVPLPRALRSYVGPSIQLRVHELGMLYGDPALRGLNYRAIEMRRAAELPLMAAYLRPYVTSLSIYTQPYRAYGSRGASIMSALQIAPGWTGTAWEILDSPLPYRWVGAPGVTIFGHVAAPQ